MKRFRKLSILLVFTMLVGLFTGCTIEEKNLADAMLKNQDILSLASTMNLNFELSAEGLGESEQLMFDMVSEVVNDLSIEIQQRSISNEDQTAAKGYVDLKVKLDDEIHAASIWVDLDMSGEDLVIKEVFKLPSLVQDLLPKEVSGKKYIVLDFEEMQGFMEELDESVDFNEVMAIAMKYQEKFVEAINKYIKNYDSKLSLVTRLKDKTVNGELIKVYQVKFDNDSFKEFLKHNIINIIKDKETIELFTEYMNEVFELTGETMPEEIDFTNGIPKAIEKIKEFFEAIEKVNILGKDGIVINYGVNKDGYIVQEEGEMDFLIDVGNIMSVFTGGLEEEPSQTPTPVFNLAISYDSKLSNINKDMNIYIPVTTEMNSISYMKIIEALSGSLTPKETKESPAFILTDNNFIQLTKEPLFINNRMLIPSRDIASALDAKIEWNGDTQEITVTKDETKLVFTVNSDEVIKNGKKEVLDTKVSLVDGTGFVPVRFAAESFGFEVEWDSANRMLTISKD